MNYVTSATYPPKCWYKYYFYFQKYRLYGMYNSSSGCFDMLEHSSEWTLTPQHIYEEMYKIKIHRVICIHSEDKPEDDTWERAWWNF
jgi:hypothetical protein